MTYRDILAALQTSTEGRIYENTEKAITGQVHQDHEKEQNEVIFDSLLPLEGDSYIIVRGGDEPTPEAAGDALLAAYEAAKLKTPYGEPLDFGNRVSLIVMPGNYDIGERSLILDNSFIDLIGIGHLPARTAVDYEEYFATVPRIIGRSPDKPTLATIGECYNVIRGFIVRGVLSHAFAAHYDEDGELTTGDHYGTMVDVAFAAGGSMFDPGHHYAMLSGVGYAGHYENCHCLTASGFGDGSTHGVVGTFIGCTSGDAITRPGVQWSFSANIIEGTYIDCKVFGAGWKAGERIIGTFTRCSTTKTGFLVDGEVSTLGSTFTDCVAGVESGVDKTPCFTVRGSLTAQLQSKFTNCTSPQQAFCCLSATGMAGSQLSATGCRGGRGSFSCEGLEAVKLAIYATDCVGGAESFLLKGQDPNGPSSSQTERVFSGDLVRCEAGEISFGIVQSNNGPEYADCTLSANFTDCEVKGLLLAFFIKGGKTSQITGKFTRCRGTGNAFYIETSDRPPDVGVSPTGEDAIFASSASFTDCHGTENCFICSSGTGNAIMSASFKDCTAEVYSFTVGHDTPAQLGRIDGTFEGCKAGDISFGGSSRGGDRNITLSGTFKDCTAGVYSFGSAAKARPGYKRTGNSVLSGTFIRCAAPNSFGCNEAYLMPATSNVLSGTFRDCTMDSSGHLGYSTHTGLLYSGQFFGCSIIQNAPTAPPVIQDAAFTRCDLVTLGGAAFARLQTGGGFSQFFACNIFGPGFLAPAPVNIVAAGCVLEQDIADLNITNIAVTPSNAIIT